MGKPNIGGKAKKVTLSLAEIEEIEDRAYRAAWEMAEYQAAKRARVRGCGHHCLECENAKLRQENFLLRNPERRSGRPR